jgi:ketosteroid isomerase-like protein
MTPDTEPDQQALAGQLEQRRWRLLLDDAVDASADLLSDAVRYVHSNGVVDDKASFLQKFRAGAFKYHSATPHIEQVTALGADALIASGTLTLDATVAGTHRHMQSIFSVVWRRESGGWRLVSLQTTAAPAER